MNNGEIITFGKHKGKLFSELPSNYLVWLYENVDSVKKQVTEELAKRFVDEFVDELPDWAFSMDPFWDHGDR